MIGSYTAAGLGFGLAFTLEDKFTATSRRIREEMGRLDDSADVMERNVTRALDRMKYGFSAVVAGASVLLPLIEGIKKAGDMEQTQIAFSTMLKDATTASNLIGELRHFADITPFVDDDIIASGRMLVAFGKDAKDVIPTLNTLGNVASGVGISMKELAEIYGKNLMQPYLQRVDIWQLSNRGIPIIEALADVMGVAKESVLDYVSEGKVGIKEMEEAFRRMGDGAGQFAGLMDAQSESLKGRVSTLQSYLSQISEYAGKAVLPLAKSFVEIGVAFADMARRIMQNPLAVVIVRLVAVLSLLSIGIGAAMIASGAFRFVVMKLALSLTGEAKALTLATIASKGYASGLLMMTKSAFVAYLPMLKVAAVIAAVYALGKQFGVWERLGKYITGISQALRSFDGRTFSLDSAFASKMEAEGLLDNVVALATWAIRFKQLMSGLLSSVKTFFSYLSSMIEDVISRVPILSDVFDRNTSSLDRWSRAGQALGYILSAAITAIGLRYAWLSGVWLAKNAMMIASNALLSLSVGGIVSFVLLAIGAVKLITYMWNNWGVAGKILAVVLGALTTAAVVLKIAMVALNVVMYANPIVWIIAAVMALIAAIVLLVVYWDEVVSALERAYEAVKGFVTGVWEEVVSTLNSAYEVGRGFVNGIWSGVKSMWHLFTKWLSNAWDRVMDSIKSGINWVTRSLGFGDMFEVEQQEMITVLPTPSYPSSGDVRSARDSIKIENVSDSATPLGQNRMNITLELDSAVIAEKVVDWETLNDGRGGTINGR